MGQKPGKLSPTQSVSSFLGLGDPTVSSSSPSESLCQWQLELARQSRDLQKVANLSYDDFLSHIRCLNQLSSRYLDENGKQLVFAVKKGSDATLLWKATVRIACVKVDAESKEVESYRALSLKQFLTVHARLKHQSEAVGSDKVDFAKSSSGDECIICLERPQELILPCAHSYCLPCIEQWNVNHKTCPVCRETLASVEEGWLVQEGPDSMEMTTEIQKSLMNLTQ